MEGSEQRQYKLPDGRILFASAGLGQDVFMACTRRESVGLQRYKSKSLPLRSTLQEAQADLDAYAKANNLELDTLVKIRRFDPDPAA
jgi:hypothetical protein